MVQLVLSLLLAVATSIPTSLAQPSPADLAPLLKGLQERPVSASIDLEKRVPLSTDDPTVAPLIDFQVFAPPAIPVGGTHCDVQLLSHTFGDGSFGTPAIVAYAPPSDSACGTVGKWATISLNLTVYS